MVPAVPYFSWTGFYIGAHVGGGFGESDWTSTFPAFFNNTHDTDGVLAGGQIGFNYQVGPWVWGVEGDISWTDLNGSAACPAGTAFSCTTDVNWLATVTGRLGYTWDRALLYVKGGAAFADNDYNQAFAGINFATASETKVGWTVGAGLEYAFTPGWSAKLEYNYIDLGTDRVTFTDGSSANIDQTINAVKAGVNYRFGWGVPGRY